jgi:hypothetical protein
LKAQKITTDLKGSSISTMYIRRTKSAIYIPFLFKPMCKVKCALIDSGASHNFIDPKSVKRLAIELTKMDNPVKVLNVDRSKNTAGIVDSYATVGVKLGSDIRNL